MERVKHVQRSSGSGVGAGLWSRNRITEDRRRVGGGRRILPITPTWLLTDCVAKDRREPSDSDPERLRPKKGPHKSFPPPPSSAGILFLTAASWALALHTSWVGELTSPNLILPQVKTPAVKLPSSWTHLCFLLGSSSSLVSPEITGCFSSHYSTADTWDQCSSLFLPRITGLPSEILPMTWLLKISPPIMSKISNHTYICDDDDNSWHTLNAYCVLGSLLGVVCA